LRGVRKARGAQSHFLFSAPVEGGAASRLIAAPFTFDAKLSFTLSF
jgi:hypothetical protein